MELKEVLGRRRTIRFYLPHRPVEREKLQKMLEAARRASCVGNVNNTNAVVIWRDVASPELMKAITPPLGYQQMQTAPVFIFWYANTDAYEIGNWVAALLDLADQRRIGVEPEATKQQIKTVIEPLFDALWKEIAVSPLAFMDVGQAIAPHSRCGRLLPGQHPGTVRLDGVDLSVVGQRAERLGVVPGREGVCRVTLMEDGKGRLVIRVDKVTIEVGDGGGGEQALVDNGPARRRRYRQSWGCRSLDSLSGQVEAALEVCSLNRSGDDGLFDQGKHRSGMVAQNGGIDGHRTPEQHMHSLGFHGLGDNGTGGGRLGR